MIIDFHAHVYPDKIAGKAVQNIGKFYNIKINQEGTVQKLLEIGRQAHIEKFVIHSAAEKPEQVRRINDFIALQCKSNTNSFIGFGALHIDMQ